jgi:hypothetical protein
MNTLAQIDAAIAKQRDFVRRKQVELEHARVRDINSTSIETQLTAGLLRQNLLDAQIVLRKLEAVRCQATPVDAREGGGSSGIFWGTEH